jgi:cytochrome c biogenesis protein
LARAEAKRSGSRITFKFDPFRDLWRLLTSVRFALIIIAFLALAGLAGVLIPQIPVGVRGNPAAVDLWLDSQEGKFGGLTEPMHRLGLFQVFESRWFMGALALLVASVTVCTVNRFPSIWRSITRPQERVPDSYFERANHRYVSEKAIEPSALATTLRRQRYSVRTFREGGVTYLFADRFAWAQLATFVSHLALILFLVGGLVSKLGGFETSLLVAEGRTAPVFGVGDPRQMQVYVDDAIGTFDDAGNPLDYRTHLVVYQGGREVARGTTTVNGPFEYGGYRFHQAAYLGDGAALRVRDVSTGNTIYDEVLPLDQRTPAPLVTVRDENGGVLLSDIIVSTDFFEPASGTLVTLPGRDTLVWIGIKPTASEDAWELVVYEPRDPEAGIKLVVPEGESASAKGMEFDFQSVVGLPTRTEEGIPGGEEGTVVQMSLDPEGEPYLTLLGVSPDQAVVLRPDQPFVLGEREYTFEGRREFSGITVKRDPGTKFIWVAAGLLLLGLALTFYVPRRRLWAKITRDRTHFAGLGERTASFEKEMKEIAGDE